MHSADNHLRRTETRYLVTAIVIFISVAVGIVLYIWFFGEQTMFVLEARSIARKVPLVNVRPIELQDLSSSTATGRKLSYFGYEFEVPWNDLDESATKLYPNRVLLTFRSGPRLMFSSGSPKELVNSLLSGKINPDNLRQLYGEKALDSDYAFVHLMLYTTPDQITLVTPRKDAVGRSMMLLVKSIATPAGNSGIFLVHNPDFEGFQYENPRSRPNRVLVDLFADDGRLEFAFYGQDKAHPLNISQAEINRIVQTARKTKAPAAREVSVADTASGSR